jgi:hypothetical protein
VHSEYLLTLAEIAVAIAGFAGLIVVVLGVRSESPEEANLRAVHLRNVLVSSFMASGFALLPATLLEMETEPAVAWRLSALIYATVVPWYSVAQVRRAASSYRETGRSLPWSYRINFGLAAVLSILACLVATAVLPETMYLPGLVYMLYGSAASFVRAFVLVAPRPAA